jgi:hypothetical protein
MFGFWNQYRKKVKYELWKKIQFPDFTIEFTWATERAWPNNAKYRMFSYTFRIECNWVEQIIQWSAGTGDIWPTRFECAWKRFLLERIKSDSLWNMNENELVIIEQWSIPHCTIEDLHRIVQKKGYTSITQLTDRYYLVSEKKASLLNSSEEILYGVIDTQKNWVEIIPCRYSYVNQHLPENNWVIQVFANGIEWFIDLSGTIPKIYPSYPAKKLNENGTFFRNWWINFSVGYTQIDTQDIITLVKNSSSHKDFFKILCQKIYPCNDHTCTHSIDDLRILNEKPDPSSSSYDSIQIWRCNKCGWILRFLWDEIGSCESDYGDWSVSTSGDTSISFDSKWNSKVILKSIIIKEYIPEEVATILYSGEELWNEHHPTGN